jgi:Fe-S cluster assembly protein SufD
VEAAQAARFAIPGLDGPRLVFADGRYVPALSSVAGLPKGAVVQSFADAIARGEPLLEAHFGRLADAEQNAFTALNTALFEDAVFVRIPAGVSVDAPIQLLSIATSGGEPWSMHPRVLIVADERSRATVIEHRVSAGEAAHFTNAVTEIVVGAGAHVRHVRIERESLETCGIRALHVDQSRDSDFASHSALFGSALLRNGVYPALNGPGCESLLNGLFVSSGRQLHDNHMRVRHAAPHCDSRQFYRGILDDDSRGVFSGRIIVDEGAQKTDAKQTSMNLLLSDRAHVEAKPQLEIYADDVKCTHGATVGQMDADAIFYLRARGIDEADARTLLIFAFANEVLDRIESEPVRALLRGLLEERLPTASAGVRVG